MMKQGLLGWSHCRHFLSLPTPLSLTTKTPHKQPPRRCFLSISATTESANEQSSSLTARERRQLRNERRESKASFSWREKVEERYLKKPKKRYVSLKEELNLDNLALLGPQWWIISAVSPPTTAELLARLLARNFPSMDFKVEIPAVHVKRKLKNGSISVKPKALYPGRVFLRGILNKELHDIIRECDGVRGFVGYKVGNTRRQIKRPKPLPADDMEAIFRQVKEEQVKADEAFEKEQQGERTLNPEKLNIVFSDSGSTSTDFTESVIDSKPKRRSRKSSQLPEGDQSKRRDVKLLKKGSTVRVVSGTFAEFEGVLEKLDRKTNKATVGFTLFGKKTLADLDVNEVVLETK